MCTGMRAELSRLRTRIPLSVSSPRSLRADQSISQAEEPLKAEPLRCGTPSHSAQDLRGSGYESCAYKGSTVIANHYLRSAARSESGESGRRGECFSRLLMLVLFPTLPTGLSLSRAKAVVNTARRSGLSLFLTGEVREGFARSGNESKIKIKAHRSLWLPSSWGGLGRASA